jgi:hypothetical protein
MSGPCTPPSSGPPARSRSIADVPQVRYRWRRRAGSRAGRGRDWRTSRYGACPRPTAGRECSRRREWLCDRGDEANLAGPVAVSIAVRDLARVVGCERLERPGRVDAVADLRGWDHIVEAPAVGDTDVHVLDEPQDVAAVPKCAAIGTIAWSLTPRLTTMLILTGESPAPAAASMPSSTRETGNLTWLIAANVSSSSASRLTVTRVRPASLSGLALAARAVPFVVSATTAVPGARSPRTTAARRAAGTRSPGQRRPSACSTCTGNCTDRSPRCADHAAGASGGQAHHSLSHPSGGHGGRAEFQKPSLRTILERPARVPSGQRSPLTTNVPGVKSDVVV